MAHGGTYSGNVVGAAAGIATLELLETQPVIETINQRGNVLMTGVGDILTEAGIPHTVTGVPPMFGMVLGTDQEPHDFRDYSKAMASSMKISPWG
jgi:glutamate-1-semialdehyde 2,1-aminomutase